MLAVGMGYRLAVKHGSDFSPIKVLTVNFRGGSNIPDPTKIYNAGHWYLLDHLSSGLIYFDHTKKTFRPLIAQHWERRNPIQFRFFLRKDAHFHDGSPILSGDVVATVKNQLIAKTSTQYRLWDYLKGCENIESIAEECVGVRSLDNYTVEFNFKKPMTSFYLQLASPEMGVWSFEDLLVGMRNGFLPKKFSGAYYCNYEKSKRQDYMVLNRNLNSFIIDEFKNAPEVINSYNFSRDEAIRSFNLGELDVIVDFYQPFEEIEVEREGSQHYYYTPTMMTYLRAVPERSTAKVGKDLVKALWEVDHQQQILNAETFLLPGEAYNLTKKEFLAALPVHTTQRISIGYISSFYGKRFIDFMEQLAARIGVQLEFEDLSYPAFVEYSLREKRGPDFLLTPYVGSERFPAVHLRFLTGPLRESGAPLEIKKFENPELSSSQFEALKSYQKWLLKSQLAIPLFFHRTEIFYIKDIHLGEQPKTDAEFELWRLQKI
jgi:hypothetical protein